MSVETVESTQTPEMTFLYTNYKGETDLRTVVTPSITYGVSEYHNDGEPCWLLVAFDTKKGDWRSFEVSSIRSFEQIPF